MTDPKLKTLNRLYEIAKDFETSDERRFYLPGIDLPWEHPAPLSPPRQGRNPIDGSVVEIPSGCWPDGYRCSPKNAPWFAHTGCDGVHFRFLQINGAVREESPVIMTVPTNYLDEKNFVVGENLLDYLSLGCRSKYNLEDLAYSSSRSKMIEFLEHPERGLLDDQGGYYYEPRPEPSPEQKILIKEFNLKPWVNIEERLQYLRDKYLHLLIIEDKE